MPEVKVNLGKSSYEIHIGSEILARSGPIIKELGVGSNMAIIITNPTVKDLYGVTLAQSLNQTGFKVRILTVPDGEAHKTLETAGRLYQELTKSHAERVTPVLALGGGVIGDLAGFVAATYLRGMPLIQIPTTLLAQVDSSIGGKVAVDHGQLKNMVGTFYQPKAVLADTSTLKTLPDKELKNGLAEVIKYAIIYNHGFLDFLENNLDSIKALDERALAEIVLRSAKIKAEVVAQDELDLGLRHILNYGHTVGHAIEATSDFNIAHGQAIAIGMVAAARIANKLGIMNSQTSLRIKKIITRAGLPTKLPDIDTASIIQAMSHDKKIAQGKIKLVLPKSPGNVFITDEVSLSLIKEVLQQEA